MKTTQDQAKMEAAAQKLDQVKAGYLGASIRGSLSLTEARRTATRIAIRNPDRKVWEAAGEALDLLK